MDDQTNKAKLERLAAVIRIGVALSAERNKERLLEMILAEAQKLCDADGGTLYLRTDHNTLRFEILRNETLGLALGGTTGKAIDLSEIPLFDANNGEPNHHNVATAAALMKKSINIADAYDAPGFGFLGTVAFDEENDYRSQSFLTIPMVNHQGKVIGVLQLINAKEDGETVAFTDDEQEIVEALASQAAVTLENQDLLDAQKELLESFIRLIAEAIDAKSPFTGAHCERVPVVTQLLCEELCKLDTGPFADFSLSDEQWYELRIASWLHDCGKITTPVHVLDKARKLETLFDRIALVEARFELAKLQASDEESRKSLEEDFLFLEAANIGGEFLSDEKKERIRAMALQNVEIRGRKVPLLSDDEVENLCISRGTLNDDERTIINGHMAHTIRMLESLPFPPNLQRVPEYAGGHHERMDGSGYPKGVFAGDMSIPARAMAVADVFEALTALDRPYKKGKTLSETMRIMGFMKKDNHLDPDIFDVFVRSQTYRVYGEKYLPEHLLDEVDEAALLAIEPKPFELPEQSIRAKRHEAFLEPYAKLLE